MVVFTDAVFGRLAIFFAAFFAVAAATAAARAFVVTAEVGALRRGRERDTVRERSARSAPGREEVAGDVGAVAAALGVADEWVPIDIVVGPSMVEAPAAPAATTLTVSAAAVGSVTRPMPRTDVLRWAPASRRARLPAESTATRGDEEDDV
ncbi:MAG: hypothetical protein ABI360_06095 [Allobranchiibius sp.]